MMGVFVPLVAKVTLILLIGFLCERVVRGRSAALRHGVWVATLVAALVLPIGVAVLPTWTWEVLPSQATDASFGFAKEAGTWTATSASPERVEPVATAPNGTERPFSLPPVWLAVWIVYALGAIAVGGYYLAGVARVILLTRRSRTVRPQNPWARSLVRGLRSVEGRRRRRPEIRCSDWVDVPVVWGVFRPTVLVPAVADEWSDPDRRAALAHECAHVDRLDWSTQQVAHLACAVYWFHPLVWRAARRLALEAERASDDRVLLGGFDATGYAEQLYSLAVDRRGRNTRPLAALAFTRTRPLAERIDSILNPHLRRSSMTRQRLVPALLLALAASLLLGALVLAPARDAEAGESANAEVSATVSPLVRAAAEGDLVRLGALLDDGADVNRADPRTRGLQTYPRTALAAAADRGQLAAVTLLLDAGAEVDLAPPGEATPLMHAAGSQHLDVVERLLGAGAEVDRVVRGDGTALIAAARGGDRTVVERLLAAGADPDLVVGGDGSPLIAATANGSADVARVLIAAGADPSRSVRGDGNPLIAAADRGDELLVRTLISAGVDVDEAVAGDGTALIRAAARGDVGLLEALIDAGADVNRGVLGDGNPLIAAAGRGHLAAVELLLNRGADVDRVVPGDENALITTSGSGHLEVAQLLVSRGADVNRRVRADGFRVRTPLNQAVRGGHDEVADWLRSVGAVE